MSKSTVTPAELAKADAAYKEGKELLFDDPSEASSLLADALKTRIAHFGGYSIEVADTYLQYGTALFESARNAIGVLGDEVKETVDKKSVEDAGPSRLDDGGPSNADQGKEDTAGDKVESESGDGDDKDGDDAKDGGESSGEEEEEEEGDGKKRGDDEGDNQEVAEEGVDPSDNTELLDIGDGSVDDLTLAWEMLEIARTIFEKDGSEKWQAHHADVLVTLGDIRAEEGQAPAAVVEYLKYLKHVENMNPPNLRRVAEAQFKIAITIEEDKPVEALSRCKVAQGALELRHKEVEAMIEAVEEKAKEGNAEAKKEMDKGEDQLEELELTMGDLKAKMEELQEVARNYSSMKEMLTGAMVTVAGASGGASASASTSASRPAQLSNGMTGNIGVSMLGAASASNPAAAPAKTQDLGVVGRGRNRVTLQPTSNTTNIPSTQVRKVPAQPSKRSLEDIMGGKLPSAMASRMGMGGGTTSIGFGGPAGLAQAPVVIKKARVEPKPTTDVQENKAPEEASK